MIDLTVLATIKRHQMITQGDRVCVAVSGGPDSTLLLTILNLFKAELDISLSVCHLNHRLRGEESDSDEFFVENLAKGLNIPFFSKGVDVAAERSLGGGSVQEAARDLRYRFFETLLIEGKADKIATAHTADDNAETLLINFLRGSGPTGLSGIPAIRGGNIIRPLIETSKEDILEYLGENEIGYRLDSSNASNKYLRNDIRNRLIPQLEGEYNQSLKQALCRTAEILGDVRSYMAGEARDALARIRLEGSEGEVVIDNSAFASLNKALQREVIREMVSMVCGGTSGFSFENLENLRNLAAGTEGSAQVSLHRLHAAVSHGRFFCSKNGFAKVEPFSYKWQGEGSLQIKEIGCNVIVEQATMPLPPLTDESQEVYIDAATVPADALFRNRREGDRFSPLGGPGTQKLKDFFIDRKIERWDRDAVLLLASDQQVLWIAGCRLSESIRVTPNTKRMLKMRVENG